MAEVWTPPAFDDITTSELVTAAYLNSLGNSLRFLKRVAYAEFTSVVNVTSTTDTAGDLIISTGAITYEAVPHLFHFSCARVVHATTAVITHLQLVDGSTEIMRVRSEARVTNALTTGVEVMFEYTPTAASHTFGIAGYQASAATTSYNAAAAGGGSTADRPGFLRITRVPT